MESVDYFPCPQEQFEQFGKVERVKKIKDYAFVHFEDRDHAVLAMRSLNGKEVGNSNIEVCGDQLKIAWLLANLYVSLGLTSQTAFR